MSRRRGSNRELIIETLKQLGATGATCSELGVLLPNIPKGSISSTLHVLEGRGIVYRDLSRREGSAVYRHGRPLVGQSAQPQALPVATLEVATDSIMEAYRRGYRDGFKDGVTS
jgi:DNA-binding HxlR family transcriptional regulator